jgi:hypothetical protein
MPRRPSPSPRVHAHQLRAQAPADPNHRALNQGRIINPHYLRMPDSPHMAAATADAADRSIINFGPPIARGQTTLARPFAPRGAMTSGRREAVSSMLSR